MLLACRHGKSRKDEKKKLGITWTPHSGGNAVRLGIIVIDIRRSIKVFVNWLTHRCCCRESTHLSCQKPYDRPSPWHRVCRLSASSYRASAHHSSSRQTRSSELFARRASAQFGQLAPKARQSECSGEGPKNSFGGFFYLLQNFYLFAFGLDQARNKQVYKKISNQKYNAFIPKAHTCNMAKNPQQCKQILRGEAKQKFWPAEVR